MKKKFKYILIVMITVLALFGIKEFWRMNIGGFAGSYPFVETYEFELSESELLKVIELVKSENPELRTKNSSVKKDNYWTFVTFYYQDTEEYVNTWTRPSFNRNLTTLAFVGLTPKDNVYKGKRINSDYYFLENRRQINKFEEQIVKPINEKIKNGF